MGSLFDTIFSALFKYSPKAFARGDVILVPALPPLLLGGLVIAAFGVIWYATRGLRFVTNKDRLIIGGLRAALFLVLGLCLLRPSLVSSEAMPRRNVVAVLLDDSRSMTLKDVDNDSRIAAVQEIFADTSALVRKLSERFVVRYFRFGADVTPVAGPSHLTASGTRTDLARALDGVREELGDLPVSGVVMVTDGADNADGDIETALMGVRARNMPVFTVGVGAERFPKDLSIERLSLPPTTLEGAGVAGEVSVRVSGAVGDSVTVGIESDGQVVGSTRVPIPKGQEAFPVPFRFPPLLPGTHRILVRVSPLPDEVIQENNTVEALVRVRPAGEKILYVEGEPRHEFAFLRRAISGDSAVQLVALVQTAKGKFYRAGVDDSLDLRGGFPTSRAELFQYRSIILGSVDATFFSGDQLRLLADFVSDRGGTLIFLGGPDALSEGHYLGTALEELIPVTLTPSRLGDGQSTGLKVHLTSPGRIHPLTQLLPGITANQRHWDSLPPVTSINQLGPLRPGAAMLLSGTPVGGGPERPVLVYQPYGRGMSILFGVQDSWLWKMNPATPVEDLSYETFWRQLLRWSLDPVPTRVDLSLTPDRIGPEETVSLRARVTDTAFTEVNDARVIVKVNSPTGKASEVVLGWDLREDGSYTGKLVGDEPGQYRMQVVAVRGADSSFSPQMELIVDARGADMQRAELRTSLLQRLAHETGGRFFTLDQVGELPAELALSKAGITRKDAQDLWDMPIVLLLFLALMTAEWGYRRYRGLA